MDLIVTAAPRLARATARWGGASFPCAIGRAGIAAEKREGDGATPIGAFPFRRVLYRADRLAGLRAGKLTLSAISADDGWCDAPEDGSYNRPVKLPYPARHERLWREDSLYDAILVVGHNDDPVTPGAGSAIFVHVAREDLAPTEGCVALRLGDLLSLLAAADKNCRLIVHGPRL